MESSEGVLRVHGFSELATKKLRVHWCGALYGLGACGCDLLADLRRHDRRVDDLVLGHPAEMQVSMSAAAEKLGGRVAKSVGSASSSLSMLIDLGFRKLRECVVGLLFLGERCFQQLHSLI